MSDQTQGGAAYPPPPGDDPDTVQLAHPDRRPLWAEWTEEERGNLATALAAARDDAGELATITAVEVAEAPPVPAEPEGAVAGVLATGETVTADDLAGMPWYEARVEIYVRTGPPGDEYGVGGDKIAHTRAATQAPSFNAASQRLDAELGVKWQALLMAAPLADQAPTPEPEPEPIADRQADPEPARTAWPHPLVAWAAAAFLLVLVILLAVTR